MKWIAKLFKSNMKGAALRAGNWFFIIAAVAVSLTLSVNNKDFTQVPKINIAFVNEDSGAISQEFLQSIETYDEFNTVVLNKNDAFKELKKGNIEAVFIIENNFSNTLSDGKFNNIIQVYNSPSSNASATISEPVINNVLMYWIEEYTIQKTNEFLSSEGKTYSKIDEINQRNQIKALWNNALPIEVKNNTISNSEKSTEPLSDALPFKWYFALSVFYLFIGSVYFIDIKKTGIVKRLELCGAKLAQVILGSLMPSVLIAVSGFAIMIAAGSIFAYTEFYKYVLLLIAALFYLISFAFISGIIVLISNNVPSILILASTFTFINAVLSELVVALPQWAVFLRNVSAFLPGKWVNVSINQIYTQGRLNAGIFICAFVYAVAYFVLCYFQEKKILKD